MFPALRPINRIMSSWRRQMENWGWRAERLGAVVFRLGGDGVRFLQLALAVLQVLVRFQWLSRPAVMNVLVRQIYFTGVQGAPWVLVLSLGGIVAVYNIVLFARGVQDLSLIGTMMSHLLVQELAPFMVAFLLLARSGVAVVTEIGHMHVRGEDAFLRSMGISAYEYLYLPRILAFALCGLILTFLFVIVSTWGGALLLSYMQKLVFMEFFVEVRRGVDLYDLIAMAIKGMSYPVIACMVLLDQGCRVGRDPNQIPVRATSGVLGALIAMVLIDALWVVMRSLF